MKVLRDVANLFKHGEYDIITSRPLPDNAGEEIIRDLNCDKVMSPSANEFHSDTVHSSTIVEHSATADISADEVETTQVGTQLSTELGSGCDELGCGSGQLGELGSGSGQLGASTGMDETASISNQSHVQGLPINLQDSNDTFEIKSPPKARGRPKQEPKAVKAKRNLAITMVQEDLGMHENQPNLLTVCDILDGTPTYNSSNERLLQFSLFKFLKRPSPPNTYEISKLPATKPLMRPEEICRIFPMDLIKNCMAKVTAYQKKPAGVREFDIALQIIGLGVFANSTIALMQKWHRVHETLKKTERTLDWMKQLDLSRLNGTAFVVEDDPELPDKLKTIPLFSTRAQVLGLTAKECQSYEIIHLVFAKKFGADFNIVVFDAEALGVVVDGKILADAETIRRNLSGLTNEMVPFPVSCNGNHWCSVMMDLAKGKVAIYDSSSSTYITSVRSVAHMLLILITEAARPSPRVQTYESRFGVQVDSYNCGVYVLLALEMFCGGEPLGHLDKKTLQCLRNRYMHMCMQA